MSLCHIYFPFFDLISFYFNKVGNYEKVVGINFIPLFLFLFFKINKPNLK
ncbi:Hypothetical Protein SLY_0743 [Strawberry lethal yellows phytoplasma (CPA) str. NZSb11]|uniref:Uncharacterized protein n=1 Tax=Strawberry lethal yellows phytoplasma (CPA) str. NZSb11 TaxID=980422 RepID=R4S1K1_PHYAS|nr:Hypothetical Protein SLY_0743 [Strawberry lethal yellows phytoplasma (CPA) str. NZSb11]